MVEILTKKERKIMQKKLEYKKLTQVEANRLSKAIRPKLRQIAEINAKDYLQKMEYHQKAVAIENLIIKVITANLPDTDSIILYGSVIQNNYTEYNDIDIMVVTKSKISPEIEKYKKIKEINDILKNKKILSDIEIISKENLLKSYKNSPTLIYQLKDSKVIYGKIKIPDEIEIYYIDLQMKLDWSYVENNQDSKEIYAALRNTLLVRLLLNKIIDNKKLKESLENEIGKNLIEKLKDNLASKLDKKIALSYLKDLLERTEKEAGKERWEKIELSNH